MKLHPFATLFIATSALWTGATPVFAHVRLPAGGAAAGSVYEAAFRVGHACQGAQSTQALQVSLPRGFVLHAVEPREGWRVTALDSRGSPVQGAGPALALAAEVRWQTDGPGLPDKEPGEFVLRGKLPRQTGALWFKVRQGCDKGEVAWNQVPAAGDKPDAKLERPAARLDLLPPGVAPVAVDKAWVRASVPGQSGTGAFMQLSAPMGARLVGVQSPVAGVAEVHEMKMEGDRMTMRGLDALELLPRVAVELQPGSNHVMLMDLKKPLLAGSQIPLVLRFEDARGNKSQRQVQVPVLKQAPTGSEAATPHKH